MHLPQARVLPVMATHWGIRPPRPQAQASTETRDIAMSEPSAVDEYDVIVIGMDPIGLTVAERAGTAGLSAAAVEREHVGGERSYWARIPSKAMLRPVAIADARGVAGAR